MYPFLVTSPPLIAQMQISPQAALERLFTASELRREWFSPAFLQQIPVPVEQVIGNLKQSLGAYQGVTQMGDRYFVRFEKGRVPTLIVLNSEGQITGLLFQEILGNAISLDEAVRQLKTLPGQVNFFVQEGKTELAALNADRALAVGSTFKLAVLATLRQQIESKNSQRSWQEVVPLQAQDKSLPSGFLQTWFDGALLTVQSLATLMISQSDNTATDTLIRLVGREKIEAFTSRNRPFLTTREAFTLKNPKNQDLLQQYRKGNEAQRRQVLQALKQRPLPNVADFNPEKVSAIDVEWFFTPRELCTLMQQVADLPLMSVTTPNGVNADDWAKVSYKGGSETGVLNLTTWLQAKNGKTYCVSATWNHDQPLETSRFTSIYSAAIAGLKERP